MNKADLIESLATQRGFPITTAEKVVNAVFNSMAEALQSGDRIEIRGFGSFSVKEYEAYTGRNPKSGEPILVKAKKLPTFKVGKDLKNKLYPE